MSCQEYEEDILVLEHQIQQLEEELDMPRAVDSASLVKQHGTKLFQDRPSFQKYTSLLQQVEVARSVTGVDILQVERDSSGEKNVVKASVGEMEFSVTYSVQKESEEIPCLRNLTVTVKQDLPEQVLEFIQRCEESNDLLGLFQGLSGFMKWCGHREETFNHYKHKYTEAVDIKNIEGGKALQLKTDNAVYSIVWCHMITDHMTTIPIIQLCINTKVTGPAQEGLPEKFQQLLRKHGIETAIDTLIDSVL